MVRISPSRMKGVMLKPFTFKRKEAPLTTVAWTSSARSLPEKLTSLDSKLFLLFFSNDLFLEQFLSKPQDIFFDRIFRAAELVFQLLHDPT